jgi:hypothetical protein
MESPLGELRIPIQEVMVLGMTKTMENLQPGSAQRFRADKAELPINNPKGMRGSW